jgi:hypothetical protein
MATVCRLEEGYLRATGKVDILSAIGTRALSHTAGLYLELAPDPFVVSEHVSYSFFHKYLKTHIVYVHQWLNG